MKLKDYRTSFIEKLVPHHDVMEAESFFNIILQELKGWKRVDLALNPDAELSDTELVQWNDVLAQLEQHRPIQYIFGKAHFFGMDFRVNENTLIPRPETEELVEWVISENQMRGKLRILDIGTGSGCIAIALAKNLPDAEVTAVDISEKALEVAKANAEANSVKVNFLQIDILEAESLPGKFDIIVSNPPYVRELEKEEINPNVLEYEPHLALFIKDSDPLLFYRKIALLAQAGSPDDGRIYFEINQYLGNETAEMLEANGFGNVLLKQDIYGNDRMVRALKN